MTFDENIQAGSGNITIKRSSDDSNFEVIPIGNTTVAGTQVTVNPSSTLSNEASYYILVDSEIVEDTSSNAYAGISDSSTWNFTTSADGPCTPEPGNGTDIVECTGTYS